MKSRITGSVIAVIALLVMAAPAQAQRAARDTAGVRAAVLDYVDGFYQGDSTRHVRSISPRVFKYGYAFENGAYRGMQMQFPGGFMNFTRGVRDGRIRTPANAPKQIMILDIEDQTASVKLVAYWGIDYLLLAKENGRWMVTHVLWQTAPR